MKEPCNQIACPQCSFTVARVAWFPQSNSKLAHYEIELRQVPLEKLAHFASIAQIIRVVGLLGGETSWCCDPSIVQINSHTSKSVLHPSASKSMTPKLQISYVGEARRSSYLGFPLLLASLRRMALPSLKSISGGAYALLLCAFAPTRSPILLTQSRSMRRYPPVDETRTQQNALGAARARWGGGVRT